MVTDSHSRVLGTTIIHNIHNPITQDTRSSATARLPITSGLSSAQTPLRLLDHRIHILRHKTSTACSIRITNKGSMAGLMELVGEGCRRCTISNIRTPTNLSICNTTRTFNRNTPHTQPMARYLGTMRVTRPASCQIQRRASHPVISKMGIRRRHAGARHNR